jgi:hypothetical protein
MNALGLQGREFLSIGAKIGQEPLDRRTELSEASVVGIPQHLLAEELPEPLDQVQVWRVGRQKQKADVQPLSQPLD